MRGRRTVVDVNDLVEVGNDDLADVVELLEVVDSVLDERGEGERGQVADGDLIRGRVLDDLRAEVRRLDRAEVLLVRLGVGGVLELRSKSSD
jgi:uncharacterized protein (UPF0297 family)